MNELATSELSILTQLVENLEAQLVGNPIYDRLCSVRAMIAVHNPPARQPISTKLTDAERAKIVDMHNNGKTSEEIREVIGGGREKAGHVRYFRRRLRVKETLSDAVKRTLPTKLPPGEPVGRRAPEEEIEIEETLLSDGDVIISHVPNDVMPGEIILEPSPKEILLPNGDAIFNKNPENPQSGDITYVPADKRIRLTEEERKVIADAVENDVPFAKIKMQFPEGCRTNAGFIHCKLKKAKNNPEKHVTVERDGVRPEPRAPKPPQKSTWKKVNRWNNLCDGDKAHVEKLYNEGKPLDVIMKTVKAPKAAIFTTYQALQNASIQNPQIETYIDPETGVEVKKLPSGIADGIWPQKVGGN